MQTAQAVQESQIDDVPETIEYGGSVWNLIREKTPKYEANIAHLGQASISQYDEETGSCGRWYWITYLNNDVLDCNLEIISKCPSGIKPTREEAMLACLNSRANLVDEMKKLLLKLSPDTDYAAGFRAGQDDIKQRISEVIL